MRPWIDQIITAVDELPVSSADSMRYEVARLRQLAQRRGLGRTEAAILKLLEAELFGKPAADIAELLSRAVRALEREAREARQNSGPDGGDGRGGRADRPRDRRHRRDSHD